MGEMHKNFELRCSGGPARKGGTVGKLTKESGFFQLLKMYRNVPLQFNPQYVLTKIALLLSYNTMFPELPVKSYSSAKYKNASLTTEMTSNLVFSGVNIMSQLINKLCNDLLAS